MRTARLAPDGPLTKNRASPALLAPPTLRGDSALERRFGPGALRAGALRDGPVPPERLPGAAGIFATPLSSSETTIPVVALRWRPAARGTSPSSSLLMSMGALSPPAALAAAESVALCFLRCAASPGLAALRRLLPVAAEPKGVLSSGGADSAREGARLVARDGAAPVIPDGARCSPNMAFGLGGRLSLGSCIDRSELLCVARVHRTAVLCVL